MMAGNRKRQLRTVLVAALSCAFLSTAAQAQDANGVLRGKVQASDHVVRLQRPKTPTLQVDQPTGDPENQRLKALVDFGDFNFAAGARQSKGRPDGITYSAETPRADDAPKAAPVLDGDAEDDSLVIAWEEWHKRVCKSIYDNWIRMSKISGIAHTTITVTREHHISVEIRDLEISSAVLERLPRGMDFQAERLREEFVREIEESLLPLEGSIVLDFPSRSHRKETTFRPYFSKDGDLNGYQWTKNDFERVQLK